MSTWFDGMEDSSNQQLPSASRRAAIRSIHKEWTKGYNANWNKTTPNRPEIKINSHADRHILAFLQLQAASCAAQLVFWPLRLTVQPASSSSQTRTQTQLARASAAHPKKHPRNVTESARAWLQTQQSLGNSRNHPTELANYHRHKFQTSRLVIKITDE